MESLLGRRDHRAGPPDHKTHALPRELGVSGREFLEIDPSLADRLNRLGGKSRCTLRISGELGFRFGDRMSRLG
jgi:hypothetical protein